jgi:hypothetical protein
LLNPSFQIGKTRYNFRTESFPINFIREEAEDMLIAMKHFGNVGVGVTSPQLFRANDRHFYVVKLQNNRLGSKVLANEFIAAKMGEIMGLCFPASNTILITEETIGESPGLLTLDVAPGRHFASLYLNHTEYVGKNNMHQAANIVEMAGILLFDCMFHNSDRTNNWKNLLLRKEDARYKIYGIDNSHLFKSARWTSAHLNSMSRVIKLYHRYCYGLLLRDWLSPSDFSPYLEKVREISSEQIKDVVVQIPEEWLPDNTERKALVEYLILRRNMVEDILAVIYKHISKSRGGM